MTVPSLDYEALKALSVELDRPVETLIAQSANTDPFYAGLPRRRPGTRGWWRCSVSSTSTRQAFTCDGFTTDYSCRVSLIALDRAVGGANHYVNTYNCWTFLVPGGSRRALPWLDPGRAHPRQPERARNHQL